MMVFSLKRMAHEFVLSIPMQLIFDFKELIKLLSVCFDLYFFMTSNIKLILFLIVDVVEKIL